VLPMHGSHGRRPLDNVTKGAHLEKLVAKLFTPYHSTVKVHHIT
jgi:hypothetical protein